MIWNGILKIHIYCTLALITCCAGCFSTISDLKANAEGYVDLSDPSANKAQVRAAKWDIGIAGVYCYMTAPALAERVTVNAGTVDVSVVCDTTDIVSGSGLNRASFSFDALAGHNYVITKRDCDDCFNLKDEATNKKIGKFSVSSWWHYQETSPVNPNASLIIAGGGYAKCKPTNEGRRLDFIEVEAGPITFNATCDTGTFRRRLQISSFNFVAEAGHTYTNTALEKDCMSLLDVTSGQIVIACEPYRETEIEIEKHNRDFARRTQFGKFADLSAGDNTADIKASTASRCEFTDKHVNHLIVDAGTVTVDSTCTIPTLNFLSKRESRVRSSFHFDAETGHSYMVKLYRPLGKDRCMQLLDITSEDITIACEPFEKVE
jgi:hypothetical protein